MIGFVMMALVMVLVAASFVLFPMLQPARQRPVFAEDAVLNLDIYSQQEEDLQAEHAQGLIDGDELKRSLHELEVRVLEESVRQDDSAAVAPTGGKTLVWLAVLVMPLLAYMGYQHWGTPMAFDPAKVEAQQAANPHNMADPAQIQAMVAALAQRMEENPDDAEGWIMLGKSYSFTKNYTGAAEAFEQAARLMPKDAQILVDYADSLAMANNESLAGRPTQLIMQALELDPNNQKALWLAGTVAYEAGNFAAAMKTWSRLASQLPAGSDMLMSMQGNLKEVRQLYLSQGGDPDLAEQYMQQAHSAASTPAASSATAVIRGTVRLDPSIQDAIPAGAVLYLFAKADNGPPMPVAIKRLSPDALPLDFTLSDEDAVMPTRKLSQLSTAKVQARIAMRGEARAQPGDWQSDMQVVPVGKEGVQLLINRQVP